MSRIRKGNINTEQFVILVVSAVFVLTLIAVIEGSITDAVLGAIEAAFK